MRDEGPNHYTGEEDYYAALGVEPTATAGEIKLAFQKLSVRCEVYSSNPQRREHAALQMARITRAYELLSVPSRRAKYERFLYGNTPPENPRVAGLFHEGYKAFRHGNLEFAVNRLREAVRLHPHRNNYRIPLAMAYAEKGCKHYAREELQQAVDIAPDDFLVQEAFTRLDTMDTATTSTIEFTPRFLKQAAGLAIGFLIITLILMNGTSQRAASALTHAKNQFQRTVQETRQNVMTRRGSQEVGSEQPGYNRSPVGTVVRPDRQTIGGIGAPGGSDEPGGSEPATSGGIPLLMADQLPAVHQDYQNMHAIKKTYYPQDNMVVVVYEDGAVMTYQPEALAGWYRDDQSGQAVMVTRDRELIPTPLQLPLLLPDGSQADIKAAGFPSHYFPEYGEVRRGV